MALAGPTVAAAVTRLSDLWLQDTEHSVLGVPSVVYGAHGPYLIPFEVSHLQSFRPGRFDHEAMQGLDLDILAQRYSGHAASMVIDARVLAIGGAAEMDGVVTAWVLASDEARERYPVFLHRSLRQGLKWVDGMDANRIEVAVADDFERGHEWVQRFGFSVSETQFEDGFMRYVKCQDSFQQRL
ncbi:MAG: hypothetical protein IIA72_08605 [Proteobacteria bacterium]|nr:hypothetical protein [Pseudomonadota bacterium]